MTVTSRFTAADDLLHAVAATEHGRESLAWVAPLPEDGLAVMFYVWRNAATGRFGRLVAVGGPDVRAPLMFDVIDGVELEGDDLDDCAIAGLAVRHPEPLQVAELAYARGDVALDVRFEALHEPFSWHSCDDGCPAWAATDRFEQSMRTSGTVRLGDRVVTFDAFGHRDHSWGERDWRALQHWKWINASTLDGSVSLHAWESLAYADRTVAGYVNRGGGVTPIRAVRARSALDERLVHTACDVEIEDAEGAVVGLRATLSAGLVVPIAQLHMHEVAMAATIDGAPAVAHVEHGWLQAYVALFA